MSRFLCASHHRVAGGCQRTGGDRLTRDLVCEYVWKGMHTRRRGQGALRGHELPRTHLHTFVCARPHASAGAHVGIRAPSVVVSSGSAWFPDPRTGRRTLGRCEPTTRADFRPASPIESGGRSM